MPFDYHLLDVFTTRRFAGNQLAVFPDGRGIDGATMQAIARELNLSETTFVLPPTDPDATHRVRIFTPGAEVPFAGHPTIGTAILLAEQEAPKLDVVELALEEGVGLVRVTVRRTPDGRMAELATARPPERQPAPDAAALAAILGLAAGDVLDGPWAPAVWSCGLPFTFAAVRSLEALAAAQPTAPAWQRHAATGAAPMVYVFTTATGDPSVQVRSRMFAPEIGVAEDPATGSACSALAGMLAAAERGPDGERRWTVHQGVEMGRPSVLELAARVNGGVATQVRVAGAAVRVGEGRLALEP